MNRIDRVSAILIQLQSKKVVRAQQIADRFNISLRTVYRDIRSLEEAGIPLSGEAGVGYSIMDGYRLPPVMFTREEAIAFLTAEKLVEKLTDDTNSRNYQSAMYKIRSVLRSSEKDLLEQIDSQVEVLKGNRQQRQEGNYTESILKAIAGKKIIRINYFSYYRRQSNERLVDPAGIFHLDHYWHLIGYCLMRNAYRDFRFDRISSLHITDQPATRQHPPLKEYIAGKFVERQLHPVTIAVDEHAFSHVGEQKYYMGFVSETQKGPEIEMSFMSPSLDGFARWFVVIADHARIIAPEALRDKVKALVKHIASRL